MLDSQLLLILLFIVSSIGLPAVGIILTLIYCYYNHLFSWQSTQAQLSKQIEKLTIINNKLTTEQELFSKKLLETLTTNN